MMAFGQKEADFESPTEDAINPSFVTEDAMMDDLLKMLARFSEYVVKDFQPVQVKTAMGETCGYFRGEDVASSSEMGVRPNVDLSMICAFLVKYAAPKGIELPDGVSYAQLEQYARQSLIYAYSTHKANALLLCADREFWGTTTVSDRSWESALWAMSLAYSAYFQWDALNDMQQRYVLNVLRSECNFELNRMIPIGYRYDTKAEENGWDTDVLAATLGLFPDHPMAQQWFDRLRLFAINSYSHPRDVNDETVIDPSYDKKRVKDLYIGQNLYDDYTLQNHRYFHTSYQNVVMQELGEAALALQLFQSERPDSVKTWKTNALMHNCSEVEDAVLNWLALSDGELAMPNGNDWSLFLYDQMTSFSTLACYEKNPDALMLENLCYKQIKARQSTTKDGSWLLRSDCQQRRMGVQAHRVMMTYLMHLMNSTKDVTPTSWEKFRKQYENAKAFPCQNVVRASTPYRFSCFSWSEGLKSYTGYFTSNKMDKAKIVVPFRTNNTGNYIGWYDIRGRVTDAVPVMKGKYQIDGAAYYMNGELSCNQNALDNRFAIYSSPRNAIIYLDYVRANETSEILAEKGGLLNISCDEFTRPKRTLYYHERSEKDNDDATIKAAEEKITTRQTNGVDTVCSAADWVNIDNEIGVLSRNDKKMFFGNRLSNNSIMTACLYPAYSEDVRIVRPGDVVDSRNFVYYCQLTAEETCHMNERLLVLKDKLPEGWNGVLAPDCDGAALLISNFKDASGEVKLDGIQCKLIRKGDKWEMWSPVFTVETEIGNSGSTATISLDGNTSYAQPVYFFIKGNNVKAKAEGNSVEIRATANTTIYVATANDDGDEPTVKKVKLSKGQKTTMKMK